MDKVLIARVYLRESEPQFDEVLKYLQQEAKVKGVSVFRAVAGYGHDGQLHSTHLVDMSLDLPIIIEVFDDEEKIQEIIGQISKMVKPQHIVTWSANRI